MGTNSESRDAARHHADLAERAIPLSAMLQVVLLSLGWGGNSPALRFSLGALPPLGAAGIRFAIALAVIGAVMAWRRIPLRVEHRDWRPLLGLSVIFLAQICLLNLGSVRTTAGRQGLLINSYPLFVPFFALAFLPGYRLTAPVLGGTLLSFAGLLLLFGERALRPGGGLEGDLLVAASGVLLAFKEVYISTLVRTLHPYVVLFVQGCLAVPVFFLISVMIEPQHYRWSMPVALSMAYQGVVVAGLCFIGWTSLLQHFSAGRLSVGFFLTPVFSALLSHLFLGEALSPGLVVGGGIILAGLLVVRRR